MIVSKKGRKRQEFHEKAVKIKCCYCDAKEDCKRRTNKEKTERTGVMTFCTVTPNKPKNFLKKKRKVKQ